MDKGTIGMIVLLVICTIIVCSYYYSKKENDNEPKNEPNKNSFHYRRRDFLMSRAEHELFNVLMEQFGSKYYIFPQVHLPTIIDNKIVGQNWHGAYRHIDEKSVDFVFCDKSYIKPLLGIELDDKSHERADRKIRDQEVERIFEEAGIPLLRIPNHGSFKKEEINRLILEKL